MSDTSHSLQPQPAADPDHCAWANGEPDDRTVVVNVRGNSYTLSILDATRLAGSLCCAIVRAADPTPIPFEPDPPRYTIHPKDKHVRVSVSRAKTIEDFL